MKTIKIKQYIIITIMSFCFTSTASAGLEISQVMYDPEGADTNREWVELYNNSSETIIITGGQTSSAWRFGDGATGDTLHYINETLEMGAGEHAILASDKDTYLSEYSYSGLIADTSMSLNNTGGVVKIWDGSSPRNVVASKSYSSDDESGGDDTSDGDNGSVDNNTSGTTSSSTTKKEDPVIFKITTKIISPKVVVAGVPFNINSLTTTNTSKTYGVGKFIWNFGDGMTKAVSKAESFEYLYEYPGEYALTLFYFDNNFTETPDAVDKITVKVLPSEVYISAIGNQTDPFIEIENKSKYEVLLSNWVITAGTHYFKIPEGTTILPNKKLKFSPKITGFNFEDLKSITITNPNNFVIATYPAQKRKVSQGSVASSTLKTDNNSSIISNSKPEDYLLQDSQVIDLNSLEASAGKTGINISNSFYSLAGLLIVILIGASSFLLIKKKNKEEDDIEKDLRAEDMTIIE